MTEQLFVGLFIGFVVGGSFGAFCMAVIFGGRDTEKVARDPVGMISDGILDPRVPRG